MGWWSDIQRERRFDRLVRPQFDGLYRFARGLARDPVGAEDLLQEAMVNALSRLDTLRDEGAFRVWVHRVVYRTFLDRVDREKRHLRRVEAGGEAQMVAFPTRPNASRSASWETGSQRRSRRCRRSAAGGPLVDLEGLTFAEAAEVLGVKQGTVARGSRAVAPHCGRICGMWHTTGGWSDESADAMPRSAGTSSRSGRRRTDLPEPVAVHVGECAECRAAFDRRFPSFPVPPSPSTRRSGLGFSGVDARSRRWCSRRQRRCCSSCRR